MILIALAGGVGALARFITDGLINRRSPRSPVPLGTLIVNILGSFGLGVVVALTVRQSAGLSPEAARVLGVGFCGGFTTFSTASLEAVKLWSEEGPRRAIAYTLLMVVGSIVAAAIGLHVGDLG